jgi:hypothetical protein
MPKPSRLHHADEFGKAGSSSVSGLDAPIIGAGASIMVDGLVERESGATPPPPPLTIRAIVIGLVVMFLIGLTILLVMLFLQPQDPPDWGALPNGRALACTVEESIS